jgi:hypothetical protein
LYFNARVSRSHILLLKGIDTIFDLDPRSSRAYCSPRQIRHAEGYTFLPFKVSSIFRGVSLCCRQGFVRLFGVVGSCRVC